jgi:hypothetical protein
VSWCTAQDDPFVNWYLRFLHFHVAEADLIIEGHLVEGQKGISIDQVIYGNAAIGDVLYLTNFLPDPPITREHFHDNETLGMPLTINNKIFLFAKKQLEKNGDTWWSVVNAKWLVKETLYSEQETRRPGPIYLLPDSGKDFLTLRTMMKELIVEKSLFEQAINDEDKLSRLQRLIKFIQPGINYCYISRSIEMLSTLGPDGVAILQHEAERPEQLPNKYELLKAMGLSKEISAVPYLIQLAANSRSQLSQRIEKFDHALALASEREIMGTWSIAIYSLATIEDRRALPELREAAIWAARHEDHGMVMSAVRGLNANPCLENIPCFKTILSVLPRKPNEFGHYPTNDTLLALINHKYLESVPLLCSQLDHPDSDYSARVHRGLIELCGQDLGSKPEPWIKWHDKMLSK